MSTTEIYGLIASFLIVFSMVFKTTTYRGTMLMRIINGIGSIFFVIYGLLLPAFSTFLANAVLFFINIFYIYKEMKDHQKEIS